MDDESLARGLQAEEDAIALELNQIKLAEEGALRDIEASIVRCIDQVKSYEDEMAMAMALSVMPIDDMNIRAEESSSISRLLGENPAVSKEIGLLEELLCWFKNDFFSWVNAPPCDYCGHKGTKLSRVEPSNQEERQWKAGRTEIYHCSVCRNLTRFPRINCSVKLLETRQGRCGEWANCFGLCCRAAGLDVRLVHDYTDHIWVEIYLPEEKRWIHADPCESIFDKPLLYEAGWGKKLVFCIAIGIHGVHDVTQRYTAQLDAVISRQPVPASIIREMAKLRTRELRKCLGEEAIKELEARDSADVMEMTSARCADEKLPGRTTGSEEWIQQRGEGGLSCSNDLHNDKEIPVCTRYRWIHGEIPQDDRIHGGVARASGENFPNETCSCPFDGKIDTKWLDFNGKKMDVSWIEYRLLPSSDPVSMSKYALTCANDAPERDPKHIAIEYFNEDSSSWRPIDEQKSISFSRRGETLTFIVEDKDIPPSRQFRLRIISVAQPERANSVQLAKWDIYIKP